MLSGDLETLPLHDLLQWADQARTAARLTIERGGVSTWIRIADRQVVGIAPVADTLEELAPETARRPWLRLPPDVQGAERVLDLFLEHGGRFELDDRDEGREAAVPVGLLLREAVHEGMRHLDEWPEIDRAYPQESAHLAATGADTTAQLQPVSRVLLRCAGAGLTLGESRLSLGLSRPALLRRIHELVTLGLVSIEGADHRPDPVAQLVTQTDMLAREGQFEEAGHVLSAVLASDPSNRAIRELVDKMRDRHRDALYAELDADARVLLLDPDAVDAPRLTSWDREVVRCIDGARTVSGIVLASPLRELETLKALRKLVRLGLIGAQQVG